jgi:threonine dehydrogenase-like Zn-dependent dehydrogenase
VGVQTEGLWYLGERRVELRLMDIPDPGPEEVLVAIEACGICNWDVQSYAGRFGAHHPYPFCAGHEGVGRVLATGSKIDDLPEGQRVTMEELPIGIPGGALMARHALRPRSRVSAIPEDSSPAVHWIVEPVCCIVNGIVYAGIRPGDRVAVVGTGYMGLIFVQGLVRSLIGRLSAFDLDSGRLALAAEFGADDSVDVNNPLPPDAKNSYDVVIETAASPQSMELSLELAKPGAVVETFAWHHHRHSFDLEDWHLRGLRFLNIQPGMNPHFGDLYPRTVALMANGTFSNKKLVTHVTAVENAADVFDAALDKTGGYIKGVITF